MKTSIILAALATVSGVFANDYKPHCHKNKCLKGVSGEGGYGYGYNPPLSSRLADCRKYQVTTVYGPKT